MRRSEIQQLLARRPFVPLKIRLDDGSTLNVPFSHVAVPFRDTLIVLKGVKKEGSHVATGKEEVAYKRISSIEPRNGSGVRRRKKAS